MDAFPEDRERGSTVWRVSSFPGRSFTKILTERMRRLPNGKDCSLGGVLRRARPDKDGCNWMPGVVANACRSALRKVVAKARLEFNLDGE